MLPLNLQLDIARFPNGCRKIIVEGTGYESQRTSKVITKLLQFMLEGPQPCTTFSFALTLPVEYFNRNVSVAQLLQRLSKPDVCRVRVKAKNDNKNM